MDKCPKCGQEVGQCTNCFNCGYDLQAHHIRELEK